jgi:CRP-like cAMP-binding protein
MVSRRRLPVQRRAQKQTRVFDPQAFLASAGIGRTVHSYRPKQAVFSQGERADAVFYIQEGSVRLTVLHRAAW